MLDYANEADEIMKAFAPYYERTELRESSDPNLLHDLETRLAGYHFYERDDIEQFAAVYYSDDRDRHPKLHNQLQSIAAIVKAVDKDEQATFRENLSQFVRLYAFLSQLMPFADTDLEKLYQFGRLLLRLIRPDKEHLPLEIQQAVNLDSYRLSKTHAGKIKLPRGAGPLDPAQISDPIGVPPAELQALSEIIHELNRRYGTEFSDDDRINVALHHIENQLATDQRVEASVKVNPPELAKLTFNEVLNELLQDMVDSHFKFYKQVNDNQVFAHDLTKFLFERYLRGSQPPNGVGQVAA